MLPPPWRLHRHVESASCAISAGLAAMQQYLAAFQFPFSLLTAEVAPFSICLTGGLNVLFMDCLLKFIPLSISVFSFLLIFVALLCIFWVITLY